MKSYVLATQGQTIDALKMASPKFLTDILKAYDLAGYGIVDRQGDVRIPPDKLGIGPVIVRALGFNPQVAYEQSQKVAAFSEAKKGREDERQRILQRIRTTAGPDRAKVISKEVPDFNRRFPQQKITGTTIQQTLAGKRKRERSMAQQGGLR